MPVEVSSVPYTFGYFATQSAAFLRLCALSRGVRVKQGPPRYLELGIGQGVSLNIHAAAEPGEYWGNDFNPAHVAHAERLAMASGTGARILPDSFAQLAQRDDLPQFDIITLHGIWSWVTNADREIIVDIAKRHLAPGGLLYVSYNCASGWAAAQPLRDIFVAHAEYAGGGLDHPDKIANAMAFGRSLAEAGAAYFKANPTVFSQMGGLANRDRTYLAHEFLGANWRPMSFFETSGNFSKAGLDFVGSAFVLEHGTQFTLNESARALIAKLDHPVLREAAIECFINPQFRQDVFAKEPELLTADERRDQFRKQHFALVVPAEDASLTIPGPRGPIALDPNVHGAVIRSLAADAHRPKPLEDVERAASGVGIDDLIDATMALVGAGYVFPALAEVSEAARVSSAALNRHILSRAIDSGDLTALASPVLGAGCRATRSEQLFLLARADGLTSREEWVDFAISHVKLTAAGPPAEEVRSRLEAAVEQFARSSLPILASLGVDRG